MFGSRCESLNHHGYGHGQWLMLPDPHDSPSSSRKDAVGSLITFDIPCQLGSPVPLVRPGCPTVQWALVPEAPVYEHGNPSGGEDDVRPYLLSLEVQPEVLPVAQASTVKGLPKHNLGLGVRPPVGPHVPGPPGVQRCRVAAASARAVILALSRHTDPSSLGGADVRKDTRARQATPAYPPNWKASRD